MLRTQGNRGIKRRGKRVRRYLLPAFIYIFKEFTIQLGKLSNHVLVGFFVCFLDCERHPTLTSLGHKELISSPRTRKWLDLRKSWTQDLETRRCALSLSLHGRQQGCWELLLYHNFSFSHPERSWLLLRPKPTPLGRDSHSPLDLQTISSGLGLGSQKNRSTPFEIK